MNDKHTPRPWHWDGGQLWGPDARFVLQTAQDLTAHITDARLIAAAPDLLAACINFVRTYELSQPNPNKWPDLHLAYQDAAKEIAKARGKL